MNKLDKQYTHLVTKILENDRKKSDRTGTGTMSIFGHQMRFNMEDGFPLLTIRKIHTRSVIHELLWFLSSYDDDYNKFGNTNIRYLLDNGVTFWSEWPYEEYKKRIKYSGLERPLSLKEFEYRIKNDDQFAIEYGSIGPGYGEQWLNSGSLELIENIDSRVKERGDEGEPTSSVTKRKITKLDGVNQIDNVIETLKKNPDSRRIIVDAWNPMRLDEMLLPPCHMMFQFYSVKMKPMERYHAYNKWIKENEYDDTGMTHEQGMKHYKFPTRYLSLQLYQRSVDVGLGLPFNIAEYSLLLYMISKIVNMIPYEFIWTGGDTHIYNNHIDQLKDIINRNPKELPKLIINDNVKSIYDFRYDDFKILDYEPHPNVKMEVSV